MSGAEVVGNVAKYHQGQGSESLAWHAEHGRATGQQQCIYGQCWEDLPVFCHVVGSGIKEGMYKNGGSGGSSRSFTIFLIGS